ncbi:hypothetical protein Droror1_Dr00015013 [Drosera rotundifolia]
MPCFLAARPLGRSSPRRPNHAYRRPNRAPRPSTAPGPSVLAHEACSPAHGGNGALPGGPRHSPRHIRPRFDARRSRLAARRGLLAARRLGDAWVNKTRVRQGLMRGGRSAVTAAVMGGVGSGEGRGDESGG